MLVLLLTFGTVEQALGSGVKGETKCPEVCTCEKEGLTELSQSPSKGSLPSVICQSKNLTVLPTGIPGDTKKL